MSVQVLLKEKNCFASAVVLDVVGKDKCRCKLDISGEELVVDATCLRSMAAEDAAENFRPAAGDVVEVRSDNDKEPGGDGGTRFPCCWWIATIQNAKGGFYTVSFKGWEKHYNEIVELDRLRPHSPDSHSPLLSVEKHTIDVPASLNDWVHDPANLRVHIKEKCGAWGLALAHPKGGNKRGGKAPLKLILLGEKAACTRAGMLLKLHAKHQVGLKGLRDQAAQLEQTLETEREKRGSSIVEEFYIDEELIGMVVGKRGSNIRRAEEESGVHSAVVDKCKVTIHGPDRDSVELCRSMLEMVREEVPVDRDKVGWIIGARGANIRELMQETGVARAGLEKDADPAVMLLVGTRDSVEQAKLWLQCHTDYLEEMSQQEEDIRTLRDELDDTSLGPRSRGGKGGGRGGKGGGRGGGSSGPRDSEDYPAPAPRAVTSAPKPKPQGNTSAPKPKPQGNTNAPKPKPQGNASKKSEPSAPAPAPKPKPNPKPAAPKPKDNGAKSEPTPADDAKV
jgi:hypothetical protein